MQTITADEGYDALSSVVVNAIKTETKSIAPTTFSQKVVPTSGSYLSEVTVEAISIESIAELKDLGHELIKNKTYKTIVVDTLSMVVNEWTQQNVTGKGKKMTQQAWGDLKTEQEEIIKLMYKIAKRHITVLTCHESMDAIEGMEDEITPDVRPSVSKGARTYLEGMANYGIHTTKIVKEITKGNTTKDVVKYAADIGPNPYYWTKLQIDPSIKVPARIINPTYDKFMKIIKGEE